MQRPKNRWIAFGLHFVISLLIFVALLLVITQIWYPGALFTAAGGWQGIKIVAGVDLVLGPLLTLIIYNASKPTTELTRDLSIIALFQFSCLAGGVFLVFIERPIAVVYAFDKFYTVKSSDFNDVNSNKDLLRKLKLPTPKFVYVDLPQNELEAQTIVSTHRFLSDPPLHLRTDLYVPINKDDELSKTIFKSSYNKKPNTCVESEILSHYKTGSVCYETALKKLKDFVPY